jgi:hypothetical protein
MNLSAHWINALGKTISRCKGRPPACSITSHLCYRVVSAPELGRCVGARSFRGSALGVLWSLIHRFVSCKYLRRRFCDYNLSVLARRFGTWRGADCSLWCYFCLLRGAAFPALCSFWVSAVDTSRHICKYFGRAAGGNCGVPTATQQALHLITYSLRSFLDRPPAAGELNPCIARNFELGCGDSNMCGLLQAQTWIKVL